MHRCLQKMNNLSILPGSYIQIYSNNIMKRIFAPCPSCNGENLFYTKYEAPLKVLKDRSWLLCKDCEYQIEMEEWKKSLYCV